MNNKGKVSEELLKTDIMQLLGGKTMLTPDTPPPPKPTTPAIKKLRTKNELPNLMVSENVNEILTRPPIWLVRWGTSVFFAVLIGIISIAWFVKYPDLVKAPLELKSHISPKTIISKAPGRLMQLFVTDGQAVKVGQVLAYFESTADHQEVLSLDKELNKLVELAAKKDIMALLQYDLSTYFSLGSVQKSYQVFQESLVTSKASLTTGTLDKQKNTIAEDIAIFERLNTNTSQQLTLLERDIQMAKKESDSQQKLNEEGYVSTFEAQNSESKYLGKLQNYQQIKASLENNEMSQNQKKQTLLEIDKEIEEQKNRLIQSIFVLKSEIEAWKVNFVAVSPIDGKVQFAKALESNMQLNNSEEILFILPESSDFYAQMQVGQYNLGKVKVGQEVIVKLQSHPYQEYGTITGNISYISAIAQDSTYLIKLNFSNGLKTSNNTLIAYKNGLAGTGEIITQDQRLLEKLFQNLRKSIN